MNKIARLNMGNLKEKVIITKNIEKSYSKIVVKIEKG